MDSLRKFTAAFGLGSSVKMLLSWFFGFQRGAVLLAMFVFSFTHLHFLISTGTHVDEMSPPSLSWSCGRYLSSLFSTATVDPTTSFGLGFFFLCDRFIVSYGVQRSHSTLSTLHYLILPYRPPLSALVSLQIRSTGMIIVLIEHHDLPLTEV